ncbi:carboxypeptidase regulatory-like domain-containing protein [candidate division KSB1 bacterium]|nr:carboxypeptidase regulatory-like domain-containing protein [candidate division KSB1 bacterium]
MTAKMLLKTFFIIICWIFIVQSQNLEKIVITGSIMEDKTDKNIQFAEIVFQIDSLRQPVNKTDQLGFFIFRCTSDDVGKSLKYFVSAPGYQPTRGNILIQAINEPIIIKMELTTDQVPPVHLAGQVVEAKTQTPVPNAQIQLRIGDIILPDTTTDDSGKFLAPLISDDLGRVITYRIKKQGFASRYGYLTLSQENPVLNITLNEISLTISGYIKKWKTAEPIEQAKVSLALKSGQVAVEYTNSWGYFSHFFPSSSNADTLYYRIEKRDFRRLNGKIIPTTNEDVTLNLELRPISAPPFYKNKYFIIGSAGLAAVITTLILFNEEPEEIENLPLPPVPPEN